MVSTLWYKSSKQGEFSCLSVRDKKGISHVEWDLHLLSLPVSLQLDTMGGGPSILFAGKPAVVMILLGIKIVN